MSKTNRISTAAPTKYSAEYPIQNPKNGRWYKSEESMQTAIKIAKTITGKKFIGRRRRCFTNGRWYVSKERIRSSLEMAELQNSREWNSEMLRKIGRSPESYIKKKAGWKKWLRENPQFRVKMSKNGKTPESLAVLDGIQDYRKIFTTIENNIAMFTGGMTERDGVETLRYIDSEREKSSELAESGVVVQ